MTKYQLIQLMISLAKRFTKLAKASYTSAMYQAWAADTASVHSDWAAYFQRGGPSSTQSCENDKSLVLSAYLLIRYYKSRGHELAELDPLRLVNFAEFGKIFIKHSLDNDLRVNKIFKEEDLDIPFTFPSIGSITPSIAGFLEQKPRWTLRQIHEKLKDVYSNKIALQFMHISNLQEKNWLMHEFQKVSTRTASAQEKLAILQDLVNSEAFNSFLNDKLKTSKRFGIEGLDSMIPGLNKLVHACVHKGVEYIGVGMAHRGRLNILANIFEKPLQRIFAEFQENVDKQESWGNSGDVKYHLGTTIERNINNHKLRLTMLPNPSHLETVNPVVMGHVKAVANSLQNGNKSLTVIVHGDAALAGQGVVYQCLQMAYLKHYNLHGIIHIVANNQIGFTTTPAEARTGLYCTDIAKSIQAPIIHINADEPELVNEAMRIAIDYRQKYGKDIFIDIIGYRRYGHNEQDQPAFTQPMMYQEIAKRPNLFSLYSQKLIKEGVVTREKVDQLWKKRINHIQTAYSESLNESFDITKWQSPTYYRVVDFTKLGDIKKTGLTTEDLKSIGKTITSIPSNFTINPTIGKIYEQRRKSIETGTGIDFGTAESLAFASLLKDGFNIRLSGQDVERGTFSHRHAVLVDQVTEEKFAPLQQLLPPNERHRLEIENSLLSEYAALGFEYGYAMTDPNSLIIWEAQFGDFANGAQIMIDNYLSCGESKWNVKNGLVMNLPHGMDGQGPEHSSARMQRYLQLMNDSWTTLVKNGKLNLPEQAMRKSNMQIICCSHAGNIFHSYRRQLRRVYRKPLISFVNKKLLKLREATTTFEVLNSDHFDTINDEVDPNIKTQAVKKVVFVTGQAYYAAVEKRKELGRNDVALVRIEQIAPFHYRRFIDVVEKYSNASEFVWFQEEHRNSGAWGYLNPRISVILQWLKSQGRVKSGHLECVSRRNSASTAVGKKKKHDEEQADLLNSLFST